MKQIHFHRGLKIFLHDFKITHFFHNNATIFAETQYSIFFLDLCLNISHQKNAFQERKKAARKQETDPPELAEISF